MKIVLTVKGGQRLYAVLLPLAGTATALCADGGAPRHLTNLPGATLFAIGLFCGRILHSHNPRPRL